MTGNCMAIAAVALLTLPPPTHTHKTALPTGTTIQIVELSDMGEDKGLTEKAISKETLMKDIQFRGAISDFYVIKQKIQDADMDPLIIRTNDHDTYGDGNNFEVRRQLPCLCNCHSSSTCTLP